MGANFIAIHAGHHYIQQDHIRLIIFCVLQGLADFAGGDGGAGLKVSSTISIDESIFMDLILQLLSLFVGKNVTENNGPE